MNGNHAAVKSVIIFEAAAVKGHGTAFGSGHDTTVAACVYDSIIYSGVNKRGRDVYCIVGVLGKSSHTL